MPPDVRIILFENSVKSIVSISNEWYKTKNVHKILKGGAKTRKPKESNVPIKKEYYVRAV